MVQTRVTTVHLLPPNSESKKYSQMSVRKKNGATRRKENKKRLAEWEIQEFIPSRSSVQQKKWRKKIQTGETGVKREGNKRSIERTTVGKGPEWVPLPLAKGSGHAATSVRASERGGRRTDQAALAWERDGRVHVWSEALRAHGSERLSVPWAFVHSHQVRRPGTSAEISLPTLLSTVLRTP
jgi:hypothetical protein